jgi:hypothetical protein
MPRAVSAISASIARHQMNGKTRCDELAGMPEAFDRIERLFHQRARY